MTEVATANKSNMADVCFFSKPFYLSRKLRCVDEIWSVDRYQLGKSVTALNTKPEVVMYHCGCHLEIAYYWYVITQPRMARFGRNLTKNDPRVPVLGSVHFYMRF